MWACYMWLDGDFTPKWCQTKPGGEDSHVKRAWLLIVFLRSCKLQILVSLRMSAIIFCLFRYILGL